MNEAYSNEELIDAVERIRTLNGEPPVTYRGNKGRVLVFRDAKKKNVYYRVEDIVNFIRKVRILDGFTADRISLPITKH